MHEQTQDRHDPPPRPPSPWPGSSYQTLHRWQLDQVRTLAEAAAALRQLAAELRAADRAGWRLAEPVRSGHLSATRPSRRRRAAAVEVVPLEAGTAPPLPPWRARLVDEPPLPGDEVLRLPQAPATPVLAAAGGAVRQVGGPLLSEALLSGLLRQVTPADLQDRPWAVAPARVGPAADLVADGSALRLHAVREGVLVRTAEAVTFTHAADRAGTLPEAAAAYERLAGAADAMAAAGGRLVGVDDGLLHVTYA